jgi:hypothetical protein
MDSDGDDDLLAHSTSTLRFYKNDGSGGGWLPENIDTGNSGITAITAGQSIRGGRHEAAAIIPSAGGGYYMHYTHNGSSWGADDGANTPAGGVSSAVIMADVSPGTHGLETIFAINENTFRVTHSTYNLPITGAAASNTIYQLASADWDGDGWNDILCATSAGLKLYLNQRTATWTQSAPVTLYSGLSVQDVVIMHLDADGLPDAVIADSTGALHLVLNRSGQVRITQSSASVTPMSPGATATVATVSGKNNGRTAGAAPSIADTYAAPTQSLIRFLHAQWVNGSWQPGLAMTSAEVGAAVESVSINAGASAAAPVFLNQGIFTLPLNSVTRTLLAASPGQTKTFNVSLKLKSSATIDRFFVEHSGGSAWMPLDANASYVPGSSRLAIEGTPAIARTLIELMSPLEIWRQTYFGLPDAGGIRGNDADFDGDGMANLVEYVTGTNPASANGAENLANGLALLGPADQVSPLSCRLSLNNTAMANPKVRVTLQASTSLSAWTTLASRTGGGSWSGLSPDSAISQGSLTSHEFTTGYTPQNANKCFLRLTVEELP